MAKLTLQDLRNNKKESVFFNTYTKADIVNWLKRPESYQKQLRNVCYYLYMVSSQFKRLIDYFSHMALFSYIVVPYGMSNAKTNKKMFATAYEKVVNILSKMNIPHEFQKIMTVIFREDIFYGICFETDDSFMIKQVPSDACAISTSEDGSFCFSVDFSYFNSRQNTISFYGDEFVQKYNAYRGVDGKNGDNNLRWQEIDSANSICIKVNEDSPGCPVPPFAGVLEALFDIEDYKSLQKAYTEIQNTKLLSFKINLDPETNLPQMDNTMRRTFAGEIEDQLPENVGYIISPFETTSHAFENSNVGSNKVSEAVDQFFDTSGVSHMLFNGNKNSSAALDKSIISDFDIVCGVLRQIERWINRRIKFSDGKYRFAIKILDVSRYNQDTMFKAYRDACLNGSPMKMAMAATLGYSPSDVLNMGMLENTILELRDNAFSQPFLSSATMNSNDPNNVGGRPESDEPLSDAGEITKDKQTAADRV